MHEKFNQERPAQQENEPLGTASTKSGTSTFNRSDGYRELTGCAPESNPRTLPDTSVGTKTVLSPEHRCRGRKEDSPNAAGCSDRVQNIGLAIDRQSHAEYGAQIVESHRSSQLARWILLNIGKGITRSRITKGFFEIEPFYCGWHVDACLTPEEKKKRDKKCRKAQPLITKTLDRLEQRGFVTLIRRRRNVKEIRLTKKGQKLVWAFNRTKHKT